MTNDLSKMLERRSKSVKKAKKAKSEANQRRKRQTSTRSQSISLRMSLWIILKEFLHQGEINLKRFC